MRDYSDAFEDVAIAYQALCRTVDAASDTLREHKRNDPSLPAFDFILRSVAPLTVPKAIDRLTQLEKGIRRGDDMSATVAFLKLNPHLVARP